MRRAADGQTDGGAAVKGGEVMGGGSVAHAQAAFC